VHPDESDLENQKEQALDFTQPSSGDTTPSTMSGAWEPEEERSGSSSQVGTQGFDFSNEAVRMAWELDSTGTLSTTPSIQFIEVHDPDRVLVLKETLRGHAWAQDATQPALSRKTGNDKTIAEVESADAVAAAAAAARVVPDSEEFHMGVETGDHDGKISISFDRHGDAGDNHSEGSSHDAEEASRVAGDDYSEGSSHDATEHYIAALESAWQRNTVLEEDVANLRKGSLQAEGERRSVEFEVQARLQMMSDEAKQAAAQSERLKGLAMCANKELAVVHAERDKAKEELLWAKAEVKSLEEHLHESQTEAKEELVRARAENKSLMEHLKSHQTQAKDRDVFAVELDEAKEDLVCAMAENKALREQLQDHETVTKNANVSVADHKEACSACAALATPLSEASSEHDVCVLAMVEGKAHPAQEQRPQKFHLHKNGSAPALTKTDMMVMERLRNGYWTLENCDPKLSAAEQRHMCDLLKGLMQKLASAGMILPENAGQPDADQGQADRRCQVVLFGTRKLHVKLGPILDDDIGEELLCRVGGGFMNFEEFAKIHGEAEARKLARHYKKRNGAVNYVLRATIAPTAQASAAHTNTAPSQCVPP